MISLVVMANEAVRAAAAPRDSDDTGRSDPPYRHALCLHPYFRDSRSGSLGIAIFPPVGLEYIAASLKPHVERVTFLDLRLSDPLRNVSRLREFIAGEIDLLCIGINWEYHFREVIALVNDLPAKPMTVVGGRQATDCTEEVLSACLGVDVLVRGEGEAAIADIARGRNLADIPGISYRRDGGIVHNPHRLPGDIARLPFPDRRLRRQPYTLNAGGFALRGEEFDIVLTARGCPHKCKFCTFAQGPWGQRRPWAARPIDAVIEELKTVTAGIVLVSDEDFFVDPRRALALCDRIAAEKLDKRFLVQSRIEIYRHPEVLAAAVRAGIKVLLIGIESPHDRILAQLEKGFTTATVRRAFETFRQFPLYCHGYFIYGNVTETEEEMMAIPSFAEELGLDSITYQKLRAEPHSPIRGVVAETPGYFVGDDHIVYSHGLQRAGLERIAKRITRAFYTPRRLWRIGRRLLAIRFIVPRNLPPLLFSLPFLALRVLAREINKKMHPFRWWRRVFPTLG